MDREGEGGFKPGGLVFRVLRGGEIDGGAGGFVLGGEVF